MSGVSAEPRQPCRLLRHLTGIFVTGVLTGAIVAVGCSGSSRTTRESTTSAGSDSGGTAVAPRRKPTVPSGSIHRAVPVGGTREVPERFFGFNGASIVAPLNVELLLSAELQKQLSKFPTRLVRIPAGTTAEWIDWRTGGFIDSPDSPFAEVSEDRPGITMADWADLLRRTGAEPVWDLNVLNSTVDDQVEMLEEAERLGLPVRLVELGNELWDPRGIYPQKFPSGTAYAEAMNEWIRVLRQRFPGIRIAVSGADLADATFTAALGDRYNDWNTGVLSTVRGADAIVIHPYWILPGLEPPGSDVTATLTAGLDHWRRVQKLTLAKIPPGMDVWLSEWNQAGHFVDSGIQIWAQALSVVAVGLEQLNDPRVALSLVHNIVDGTSNPHDIGVTTTFPSFTNGEHGTRRLARTALGYALPELFSAAGPDSTAQRLRVDGVPTVGGHSAVMATMFTGSTPGALFVNLTDKSIVVELPKGLRSPMRLKTVSALPESAPGWMPDNRVTRKSRNIAGTAELPPYSIGRLHSR